MVNFGILQTLNNREAWKKLRILLIATATWMIALPFSEWLTSVSFIQSQALVGVLVIILAFNYHPPESHKIATSLKTIVTATGTWMIVFSLSSWLTETTPFGNRVLLGFALLALMVAWEP